MDGELRGSPVPVVTFPQNETDCRFGPQPWIEGPNADIASQFSCVAAAPYPAANTNDCQIELPYNAIQGFGEKVGPGQPNEGFYNRDEQDLLVFVIITDEDQTLYASGTQLADTAPVIDSPQIKSYLDNLAGGEERYGVIAIAGPGPGQCTSSHGSADEAEHLKELVNSIPNGVFGSICDDDLPGTLQKGLEKMIVACDELPPIL